MELFYFVLILSLQSLAVESENASTSCLLSKHSIQYNCVETFDGTEFGFRHVVTYSPKSGKLGNYSVSAKLCWGSCKRLDDRWRVIPCPSAAVTPVMTCTLPSDAISWIYMVYVLVVSFGGISCNTTFEDAYFSFYPSDYVIPLAPQNVIVQDIQQRSVQLSWIAPKSTRGHAEQYLVKYHSEFQDKNMTEDCQIHTICRIDNLHAGAQYRFWLITNLIDLGNGMSLPGGPLYLVTKEAAPSERPGVSLTSHNTNKETRKIFVNLTYPDRQKWNGNISTVSVYHCQTKSMNQTCTDIGFNHTMVNSSKKGSDQFVITDQSRRDFVHVVAKMCTKGGCVNSTRATVGPNFDETNSKDKIGGVVAGAVIPAAVIIFVIVIIVILIYSKFRVPGPQQTSSSQDNLMHPDNIDGEEYEEMDEHQGANYYRGGVVS